VNKRHPYRELEREYITTDISLRELCRRHSIRSHSLVVDQSQKHDWVAKREAYPAKESESFIERHVDRMADRQAEIHDKILDGIDEALDKFRSDMRATGKKLVNGEWVEVPVMRLMPKDVAILLDRLEVLFDRPSHIHEGRTVTSELPIDALNWIVEMTRGRPVPPTSPLPRRRLDD